MPPPEREGSTAVIRAQELFRAWTVGEHPETSPSELISLGKALVYEQAFGYARRVLEHVETDDPAEQLLVAQQRALATYKDHDLRAASALQDALTRLGDLATRSDAETLGIAGAVYKRLWEVDGNRNQLELALACYRRGYGCGTANNAYPGINAAFVLDILAAEEEKDARLVGARPVLADERRAEATRIRREIVAKLAPSTTGEDWWNAVTLVEAHLGLGDYSEAKRWAKAASTERVPLWQLESTARQLTALALLRLTPGEEFATSEAGSVLAELFDEPGAQLSSLERGKVGLALSGGGFRASFFHIGVLAALAERDALRHVEVLSCVSGGSILGAHFYLKLKKLLEEKPDAQISREDYLQLVVELSAEFLAGVQEDIRARVAANPITSLKTLVQPGFTRTERGGELVEKILYRRVDDADGKSGSPRLMKNLKVSPKDHVGAFRPQDDNWRRAAKVPILVLNATTLNTGHNWQFTATWMGEPPAGADASADRNDRLRRMYYEKEAPGDYGNMRLGVAVAASACVPGLFEPIVFDDLYEGLTLRLVDGGVYDNQGIGALLDEDCSVVLVSDASGQMPTAADIAGDPLGVAGRSNSVLMARVRCSEYADLAMRMRSGLLRGLMYVHLRKGLGARNLSWKGAKDPYDPLVLSDDSESSDSYGIPHDVQSLLATVRTDLDAFTDIEAYALMASGYRMTQHDLCDALPGLASPVEPKGGWPFRAILDAIDAGSTDELRRQLDVSRYRTLKLWRLMRSHEPPDPNAPPRRSRALLRNTSYRVLSGAVIGTLGPVIGGLQLGFVDRWFLKRGRTKALGRRG